MGRCPSPHVDYDHLRKVCSAVFLTMPSAVAYFILVAIGEVSALTNRSAVDPRFGALEATLATHKERVSTLEPQVASRDIEIASKKKTQLSNL